MDKNILVTGATGHFGKAVIGYLLEKGAAPGNIFALVRNEEKGKELKAKGVTLKLGDYDNYSSLEEAFQGIDELLFISASDIFKRGTQHENVVKAAKESGIKHIYYTSFVRKNETETSPIAILAKAHINTEKAIKASGMKYTIFRNNLYMDGLPMFLGNNVMETGIFLPAGNSAFAFALRNEMAEAAANVILGKDHENKDYDISNSYNSTFHDVARILSQISNKQVTYTDPDPKVFKETLGKAGVPDEGIALAVGFAEAIKQGEFTSDKTDLEHLLGRKPTSMETYLKQMYVS